MLTKRQLEVLDYIHAYMREHRLAPTVQEIGDEFSLSKGNVHRLTHILEEKGFLRIRANYARGIELLKLYDPLEHVSGVE